MRLFKTITNRKLFTASLLVLALLFVRCEEPGEITGPGGGSTQKPDDPKVEEPDVDPPVEIVIPTDVYVVNIVTDNPGYNKDNIPKNDYISASVTIKSSGGSVLYDGLDMEIKGRGNSTWNNPKKPFKIRLAEKKRLLGMSNSRHWVLLANYNDKSLLRNEMAFELARLAGMEWAPRSKPVEVYINGKEQGLYTLTEHVRAASERIEMDVVSEADNAGAALTGGYLLVVDDRKLGEGVPGFRTKNKWLPVAFDDPETPTAQQKKYVEDYFNLVETTLYTDKYEDYEKLIDIPSFIQYFFVQEITKNIDGNMRLSTYMSKPKEGKLGFPCVWDFDLTLGNCYYLPDAGATNGPTGWHIRNTTWFRQLFRNKTFAEEVRIAWLEFYPKLGRVEDDMRQWARVMDAAQQRNFRKWPILGKEIWPNWPRWGDSDGGSFEKVGNRTSYQKELDFMLDYFHQRVEWMNGEIEERRHFKRD